MSQATSIREPLRLALSGRTRVLASELGNLIRRLSAKESEIPLDLKATGGILTFVETYLSGLLMIDPATYGPTLAFTVLSAPNETSVHLPRDENGQWKVLLPESREIWDRVTNPKYTGTCAWFPEDQSFRWSEDSAPPPVGVVEVPRIDVQDYARFAVGFVEDHEGTLLSSDAAEQLRAAASDRADASNSRLLKILRTYNLVRNWERYRGARILDFVKSRMDLAGAPTVAKLVVDLLEASRGYLRSRGLVRDVTTVAHQQRSSSLSATDLKRLLIRIVPLLKDEDILALRLPLGSVLHCLESVREPVPEGKKS